jgi:hypothetical protein
MKYSIAIAALLCTLTQSIIVRKSLDEYEGDVDTEEKEAKDSESMSAIATKMDGLKTEDDVLIKEYAIKLD